MLSVRPQIAFITRALMRYKQEPFYFQIGDTEYQPIQHTYHLKWDYTLSCSSHLV